MSWVNREDEIKNEYITDRIGFNSRKWDRIDWDDPGNVYWREKGKMKTEKEKECNRKWYVMGISEKIEISSLISYSYLKTINGTEYPALKICMALGLLEDDIQ